MKEQEPLDKSQLKGILDAATAIKIYITNQEQLDAVARAIDEENCSDGAKGGIMPDLYFEDYLGGNDDFRLGTFHLIFVAEEGNESFSLTLQRPKYSLGKESPKLLRSLSEGLQGVEFIAFIHPKGERLLLLDELKGLIAE